MPTSSHISILIIGVSKYDHLGDLTGTITDSEKIEQLLVMNKKTALYSPNNCTKILDPTSSQFRKSISDYVCSRTAPGDILILYFSGHGISLDGKDFGFCTRDTQPVGLSFTPAPIPVNLVRLSDVIESLTTAKVEPIIIIDACLSGVAGEKISELYDEVVSKQTGSIGSSYEVVCASTKYDSAEEYSSGGVFTSTLHRAALEGISGKKNTLQLSDIYNKVKQEGRKIGFTPQYFSSHSPPECEFVKNIRFRPNLLKIGTFVEILNFFWNNGNPQKRTIKDLQRQGSTAHTTYSKLTYTPWELISKEGTKNIGLSDRGVRFMKNKLFIPDTLEQDPQSKVWKPSSDSKNVSFKDIS